jgi:hypothetical protein
MLVQLREIAHVRSGDKGDTANLVVIAYTQRLYPDLKAQMTAERVCAEYEAVVTGGVQRFCVDELWVLNFVLAGALGGGVSRSLRLDQYGKALASAALGIELTVSSDLAADLRGPRAVSPR